MAFGKRYTGTYYTNQDIKWTVEIWCKDYSGGVGDLTFPDDEPLTIEWEEKGVEEPIMGSNATLKVISPGDRTYMDLYSIKAGEIRMDVQRDDKLYWSGTLDPEFYEEPYATVGDYEVSLTFTDFGIFERLKYNLTGVQSIDSILKDALERSGINFAVVTNYCRANATDGDALSLTTVEEGTTCGADTSMITTQRSSRGNDGLRYTVDLSTIGIKSENWTDEDGEVSNLKDVITHILTPLALKIRQKAGKIYVFDPNGLAQRNATRRIEWASDDQVLGTGEVCNTVKVTFSPYASSSLDVADIKLVDYDKAYYHILSSFSDVEFLTKSALGWRQTVNVSTFESEDPARGFTLHWGKSSGIGATININEVQFFHLFPWNSGEECDGIAALVSQEYFKYISSSSYEHQKTNILPRIDTNHYYINSYRYITTATTVTDAFMAASTQSMFSISGIRIEKTGGGTCYRLKLPMLLDVKYNPYEDAGDDLSYKNKVDWVKHYVNWVYVPIRIILTGDDGHQYVFCNWSNASSAVSNPVSSMKGTWVQDGDVLGWGSAFLSYYSYDDRVDDTGVLGWQENKHTIPRTTNKLNGNIVNRQTGEYIPSPPVGGTIQISVGDRLILMNDVDALSEHNNDAEWTWLLFKKPTIELVNVMTNQTAEQDDVTYKGVINSDAKDDKEVDTNCGTLEDDSPLAKGCFLDMTKLNEQIHTFVRESRNSQAEKLLIGTIYSQTGDRMLKLSGTINTSGKHLVNGLEDDNLYHGDDPLGLVREVSAGDDINFAIASIVEDCSNDTAEIVLLEISEDEYIDVEVEDE